MSKLSTKGKEITRSPSTSTRSSTPKHNKQQDNLNLEDSPISFTCTQEARDNLDVIWNWHSPSTSARPRRQIPKNPRNVKTTAAANIFLPLRNDKPDLQKVQNDLESLQKEIGVSQDDDDSFLEINLSEQSTQKPSGDFNMYLDDDTIEEEMIIASQVAEQVIFKAPKVSASVQLPDDSFDMALQTLDDDDIALFSHAVTCTPFAPNRSKSPLKRSPDLFSDDINEPAVKKPAIYTHVPPMQFSNPRTIQRHPEINGNEIGNKQKFKFVPQKQSKFNTKVSSNIPQQTPLEIEKQRLANLAKIESATKLAYPPQNPQSSSSNPQNALDSPSISALPQKRNWNCSNPQNSLNPSSTSALPQKPNWNSSYPQNSSNPPPISALPQKPNWNCSNPQNSLNPPSTSALPQKQNWNCSNPQNSLNPLPISALPQKPNWNSSYPQNSSKSPPLSALAQKQNWTSSHPQNTANSPPISAEMLKEIERKRLAALAKKEAKKHLSTNNPQQQLPKSFKNREKSASFPFKPIPSSYQNPKLIPTPPRIIPNPPQEPTKPLTHANPPQNKNFPPPSAPVLITDQNRRVWGEQNPPNAEDASPTKCSSEEIERKRLEALAKREAKKPFTFLDKTVRIQNGFVPDADTPPESSPIKCSPDQIEKKRLEALAKREARKQLFSGGILAPSTSKTFGTSLMRHHSTDFTHNPPENTRILNNSAKQKSWNEQMDERVERNRLEALRRLQFNKERKRNVP